MEGQPDNINTLPHQDGVTIDTSKIISPPKKFPKSKDLLKCDYCDKMFEYKISYHGHMRGAHKEQYYKDRPDKPIPPHKGGRPKNESIAQLPNLSGQTETIMVNTPSLDSPNGELKKPFERPKVEEDEVREERDPTDNTTRKAILSKKSINLGGRELYMSELLINLGFAKDLAELQKKSLHLAFSMMNMGDLNTMMGEKKESITDMIEQLQKQELLDVQMEALKNKVKQKQAGGGSKMETSEMLLMMMMMNNNQPKNNSSNDMMELFKMMMMDNKKDTVSEMQKMMEFQRYLTPQKNNDDNLKQQLEFLRLMIDNKRNDNDKLPEILKIIADKDKDRYERDMQIQQLKDESNRKLLDMKVTQLESQVRNTPSNSLDLEQIKATISAIKEVSGEIGGDRKPSTLDYIQTIGENFGPVVTELIKSRNAPAQSIQAQVMPHTMRNGMVHAEMTEQQDDGQEEDIDIQPSTPLPVSKPIDNILNNFDSWIPRTPVELPGGRT